MHYLHVLFRQVYISSNAYGHTLATIVVSNFLGSLNTRVFCWAHVPFDQAIHQRDTGIMRHLSSRLKWTWVAWTCWGLRPTFQCSFPLGDVERHLWAPEGEPPLVCMEKENLNSVIFFPEHIAHLFHYPDAPMGFLGLEGLKVGCLGSGALIGGPFLSALGSRVGVHVHETVQSLVPSTVQPSRQNAVLPLSQGSSSPRSKGQPSAKFVAVKLLTFFGPNQKAAVLWMQLFGGKYCRPTGIRILLRHDQTTFM